MFLTKYLNIFFSRKATSQNDWQRSSCEFQWSIKQFHGRSAEATHLLWRSGQGCRGEYENFKLWRRKQEGIFLLARSRCLEKDSITLLQARNDSQKEERGRRFKSQTQRRKTVPWPCWASSSMSTSHFSFSSWTLAVPACHELQPQETSSSEDYSPFTRMSTKRTNPFSPTHRRASGELIHQVLTGVERMNESCGCILDDTCHYSP